MRRAIALAALAVASTVTPAALAQRGMPTPSRPPPQSSPSQEPHAPTPEEEEELHNAYQRASEPEIAPPTDPLAISPEIKAQIGSDYDGGPPSPVGPLVLDSTFPTFKERRGDYQLKLVPPFYFERTRGLTDPSQARYGIPQRVESEGVAGVAPAPIFYYWRRSLDLDMSVLFPPFWHVRDRDNYVTVVGPVMHREAPGETDNWLAPLYFFGSRRDGGYFHSPALLTLSHWDTAGSLTLVGPFFRSRTGASVDLGVAPLFFHGDNGSIDGNLRTYTLIPELLFYHSAHELDSSTTTIVGPVITQSDAKRDVFDLAPFFFHISGKPETGGVPEYHTTVFPLFHYGRSPDASLFILPGYLRRVSRTSDTLISPFYSHATTRNGATSMTTIGPGIGWNYTDKDLGVHAWAIAPIFYTSDSPAGHDWLTPLLGHFESYGVSSTWWAAPSFTFHTSTHGWENDLHPLVYIGRNDESSHTVVAPVFWDFADPKGRTTIGFPLYWRFAEGQDDSVTQVAANTLYLQKRVAGGTDWSFHFLPFFSYGEEPNGYFWNFLFGMAGYSRHGKATETRVFWLPIEGGVQPAAQTAIERR